MISCRLLANCAGINRETRASTHVWLLLFESGGIFGEYISDILFLEMHECYILSLKVLSPWEMPGRTAMAGSGCCWIRIPHTTTQYSVKVRSLLLLICWELFVYLYIEIFYKEEWCLYNISRSGPWSSDRVLSSPPPARRVLKLGCISNSLRNLETS